MRYCILACLICLMVPVLLSTPATQEAWGGKNLKAPPPGLLPQTTPPSLQMDLQERMRFLEGLSKAKPMPMARESTPGAVSDRGPASLLRFDPESGVVKRLPQGADPKGATSIVPESRGRAIPGLRAVDGGDGVAGEQSALSPAACTPPPLDLSTHGYPWRTVVKLLMRFNVGGTDYFYSCSAATVHPFHLLTAAHCIYNFDPNDDGDEGDARFADEVWAWPAHTDLVDPFANCDGMCPLEQDFPWGVSKAVRLTTYDAWTEDHDYDYDIAYITLDRRIGDRVGWMGAEAGVETASLNFDGYPTEDPYVPSCTVGPYPGYDDNNVDGYSTHRIDLCAYVYGGHSGGPEWRFDGTNRYIQGVNSTSDRMGDAEGTRLTASKMSDLYDTLIPDDEANNPPVDRPELIEFVLDLDAKDLLDNSVCQGTELELEYNVFNVGYEESGAITVYFYLSDDLCIDGGDYLIGSVDLASLGPNSYYNTTASPTVPCSVPAGTYYAGWFMSCTTAEYGTGDNTAVIGDETVAVTSASDPPLVTVEATGGSVDENCEFTVPFEAVATDDCGLLADDVSVSVNVVSGAATVGTPSVNAVQTDDNTVTVDGTVLVTDVTGCPAVIQVTVTALDLCGNSGSAADTAHVVDEIPPDISLVVDPDVLWPPNHKMATVTVEVTVEDACDAAATFVLTSITSDEPDNGIGDGDTDDDIQGADFGTADTEFQLRSERAGGGDGRTYTITYTATDGCGNSAEAVAEVNVPHDQSGQALALSGFIADGSGLSADEPSFFVAIPARSRVAEEALPDPTTLEWTRAFVGNLLGRIPALSSGFADVDDDGLTDLVLEYPARPVRQLIRWSAESQEPVGFRYEDAAGDGYLVADILALGTPFSQPVRLDPPDEGFLSGRDPAVSTGMPGRTALIGIQPNPFSPSTTVWFDLAQPGPVRIDVFDLQGARVRTLVDGDRAAGRHSATWDGRDRSGHRLASGVYLFRFAGDGIEEIQKVVLMN